MSILAAIGIAFLFSAAIVSCYGFAYWLGSLPKRGEFNELRKVVNELREELRRSQYRTASSR